MNTETAALETERPALTVKDGIVLSFQDLGLWKGEIATDLPPAGSPALRWTGTPIPLSIWHQLAGFFRHANATWKSEAQSRLFYKADTKEWKVVVAPQRVATGMFSGELKGYALDAEKTALRDKVFAAADGFQPNGTAHSHCDCSAFQSGTDHKDELSQPGVHITFGRVSSDRIHVHGRVSFRKIIYPINWADWFPDWPKDLDPRRDEFELVLPERADLSFPKEWLDCCFPYVAPPPAPVYYGGRKALERWNKETRAGYGYGFGRRDEEEWRPADDFGKKKNSSRTPNDLSEVLDTLDRDFVDTGCTTFADWAMEQLYEMIEHEPACTEQHLYSLADDLMDGYNALVDGLRTLMDQGMPLETTKEIADEYVYGSPEDRLPEDLPPAMVQDEGFPFDSLD